MLWHKPFKKMSEITLSSNKSLNRLVICITTNSITIGRKNLFGIGQYNITDMELRETFIDKYIKQELGNNISIRIDNVLMDYNIRALLDILTSYQKLVQANNISETNKLTRKIVQKQAENITIAEFLEIIAVSIIGLALFGFYKGKNN